MHCICKVHIPSQLRTIQLHIFDSSWLLVGTASGSAVFRVNIKKVAPLRLSSIFHQCVKIFAWNFTQLLSNQIYILSPSLVEIYWKWQNLCYFNEDNPPFLSIPSIIFTVRVVCWRLWKEPVCWWWDEDVDLQTDRDTADARSDHHKNSTFFEWQ